MPQPCVDLPVYCLPGSDDVTKSLLQALLPQCREAGLKVVMLRYRESDQLNDAEELRWRKDVEEAADYSFAGDQNRLKAMVQRLLLYHDLLFMVGDVCGLECCQLSVGADEPQTALAGEGSKLVIPAYPHTGAFDIIRNHATRLLEKRAVWACILIGGKSSRMGRPKHLIKDKNGTTWLERLVALIEPRVSGIVLSGQGEVPESLDSLVRIPDVPDVQGPLTGVLSAMRWQPEVSWLLLACDMPHISDAAIRWLLESRSLGAWADLPTMTDGRTVEPLFARYEPQCKSYFEELYAVGERRIGRVARFANTRTLPVPPELQMAWSNINTPQELQGIYL